MKFVLAMIMLVATLATSGCKAATVIDPDYAGYLEHAAAEQAQRDILISKIASGDGCPPNDGSCVVASKAMAAMAAAMGGGSARTAAPARKMSGVEKFATVMSAMSPLMGTMVNGVVSMQQTKTSRDVSIAQYDFLGGVIRDTSSAAATVATSGPRIEVGGDYVSGTQTHTTVGRDQIGRDQYQGPVAGGDQIGRDRTDNDGVIHVGDNDRYDSPGPYENQDEGDGG